jgi:hypothetical protein
MLLLDYSYYNYNKIFGLRKFVCQRVVVGGSVKAFGGGKSRAIGRRPEGSDSGERYVGTPERNKGSYYIRGKAVRPMMILKERQAAEVPNYYFISQESTPGIFFNNGF